MFVHKRYLSPSEATELSIKLYQQKRDQRDHACLNDVHRHIGNLGEEFRSKLRNFREVSSTLTICKVDGRKRTYPKQSCMRHAKYRRAFREVRRNIDREVLVRLARSRGRLKVLGLVRAREENGAEIVRDVLAGVLLTVLQSDGDADFGDGLKFALEELTRFMRN